MNDKTLLEPPPGMRGILPGALVEVESRYELGRGMVVTRIEEVLAPGGGTPVAEARAYRERGLRAEALALLGAGALSDAAARATRARLLLDDGRMADAAADVRAILESGHGDAMEPWDVASLVEALDEPSRAPLLAALGAWLAKTSLAPGCSAVQRAMRLAPSSAWTTAQLFARLASANAVETLSGVVAEMRSRGLDDERVRAAEAALAGVEARESGALAVKRAHRMLQAALRVAHKSVKPPPPYHLGGPAPRLSLLDLVRAAALCASRVRDLARPEERDAFDRALAALNDDPVPTADLVSVDAGASAAMHVLMLACIGAERLDAHWLDRYGKKTAVEAVRLLQSSKRPDEAAALIRDLDAFLVDREWRTLLASHAEGAPPVASVLWRGDDGKKALGHVLVGTPDGRLALLSKSGRRWRWHTGSRDDVLATVPDAHFAEATRRALP